MKSDKQDLLKRNPRIMLVDDEPDILRAFKLILKTGGFKNVQIVDDGLEAVAGFEKDHNATDLVLIDWKMRKLDVISATRTIKSINLKTKAIIFSGFDELLKSDEKLFEAFLKKPVRSSNLIDAITSLL
jgi:two-component system response regulator YesN